MNQTQTDTRKGFVDFRYIKDQVSLVEVLEHYQLMESLKKSGDRLSGACPIHGGSNVTQFRVSVGKNCFNCFGSCGRGGNVIDFVSLMEDVPFRDAAVLLQKWFLPEALVSENDMPARGRKRPGGRQSSKRKKTTDPADSDESDESNPPLTFELKTLQTDHSYFVERGVSDEAVSRFGLGYCSRGCLRGHVVVPIHNAQGELVAYAGRWPKKVSASQPKYMFPKGFRKSLELFNIHRALEEPEDLPLVIVEGFFDCIALWEAGVTKCVALMGSHLSERQEQLLVKNLEPGSRVEVLLDADKAGRKGADRIRESLGDRLEIRRIELPEEGMQPDHVGQDDIALLFE